ncbi:nucleotidyltransferase family protein [Janibacter sp. GS2]|uniref:nucleotidyltransferase family protein n=1 Tax=Janibacter sp. GS2 TaxID=3442646 RepID=UPI003EB730D4
MSPEPLTVAEAVPIGTVHLQRMLDGVGVRSLAIKGPAFVALGVRPPRQSNDIDLLIHEDDRATATEALAGAKWSVISHWFPSALDEIIYSTTFRHALFPVTLDLHHRFSGLLTGAAAFETLWDRRTQVEVAHQAVVTVGREHALVLEALNAMKLLEEGRRAASAARVVSAAEHFDAAEVAEAALSVGARHTAAPLITALGGGAPVDPPPPGYRRWQARGARNSTRDLIVDLIRRAPGQIPRVVWQQLTLDPATARFWAHAHGLAYRSRWQILGSRIGRTLRR